MKRNCLVCGAKINVTLRSRIYAGGHYFGKFKLPVKPGEYKKLEPVRLEKLRRT